MSQNPKLTQTGLSASDAWASWLESTRLTNHAVEYAIERAVRGEFWDWLTEHSDEIVVAIAAAATV